MPDRSKITTNRCLEANEWLVAAQQGCEESLGKLLQSCHDFLLLVATREIPSDLRSKVDPADLVQETLLEGRRHFARFQGRDLDHFLAWLREIELNRVRQFVRRYRHTQKRDLSLEVPLDDQAGYLQYPHQDSPSRVAMRAESAASLEVALAHLPADYRRVVLLRNLEHCSFAEIGRQLGRSPEAIRKLWFRAIMKLQACLGESPENE